MYIVSPIQTNLWQIVCDERSYVTSPDCPAATTTYTESTRREFPSNPDLD